jgi:hypothetical protein
MNKEELVYFMDVIKVYTMQGKEFRDKFKDILISIDKELEEKIGSKK